MAEELSVVDWLDWNQQAFVRAETDQKPVLLSVGTTWCQSCAEMDKTSYADPSTATLINTHFVPVKVDADRRPDIGARYNLGGWPTTAVLTPGGEVLSGGTYVSPIRLPVLLEEVADAFSTRRPEIDGNAASVVRHRETSWAKRSAHLNSTPDTGVDDRLCAKILNEFDSTHGGFGFESKLPNPDAISLAIEQFHKSGDERFQHIATTTLNTMSEGGLYDKLNGGFFRYCSDRNLTLPSSEKILSVNAAMLRIYLRAWEIFQLSPYRDKSIDIIRYVHKTLADVVDGGFFASQGTDDSYYTSESTTDRSVVSEPLVDCSLYTDANALMATAYVHGARVLSDDSLLEFAIKSLERVVLETYERGDGVAHSADEATRIRGLLTDQIHASAAFLDLYDATHRDVYLDMAQELIQYAIRTMWDKLDGGFFDRAGTGTSGIGLLREPIKPFETNCEAARVLSRLSILTENSKFLEQAYQTLASQTNTCRANGLTGAAYVMALRSIQSAK